MPESTPPAPAPDNDATLDSGAMLSQSQLNPTTAPVAIQIEGYRLLEEVSRGGQAIVYAATFLRTTRKVAVKIMREGPLATEAGRARFTREGQILASLNHPNIVTILDRGRTADGSEYFAMDFIDGPPLDQGTWKSPEYLASVNENPAKPLQLFLKICDAVNAAHLRGIVHRDLKPSNIRLDERGEPHVLDFGLARGSLTDSQTGPTEPITITGQFLGSLPWASPEQAEGIGQKIDMRSDVYSLGVILYQLVTAGHFPYQVIGSMRDILNNIMTAEPPAPSSVLADREARDLKRRARRAGVPTKLLNPVLDAIVLRALAKRRDDRYQSAGELARDIENSLAGRPTVAGPQQEKRNRRPMILAGAAVGVLAIAGIIAFVVKGSGKSPSTSPVANTGTTLVAATQTVPATTPASGKAVFSAAELAALHVPTLAAKSPLVGDFVEVMALLGRNQNIVPYFTDHAAERLPAWRAAADQGDAVGQLFLSRCYEWGAGVTRDGREANSLCNLASDQGLGMAMEMNGTHYRFVLPPNQDLNLALTWYRRAAEAGDGRAMCDLGVMYRQGVGVAIDNAEALKWFRKAAELDVPVAFLHLGDLYLDGEVVTRNLVEATRNFRRAAEAGVAGGMFSLGQSYMYGRGIDRDPAAAMNWYRQADAAGNLNGAMGIGDLYAGGLGVTQDYSQAAIWYLKSATAGSRAAMRKLAIFYEQGTGVPKDPAQARDWYTKAADAGDAEAIQWMKNNPTP